MCAHSQTTGPSLLLLKRNVLPALFQNNENSSDCKFELKCVELTGSDSVPRAIQYIAVGSCQRAPRGLSSSLPTRFED